MGVRGSVKEDVFAFFLKFETWRFSVYLETASQKLVTKKSSLKLGRNCMRRSSYLNNCNWQNFAFYQLTDCVMLYEFGSPNYSIQGLFVERILLW